MHTEKIRIYPNKTQQKIIDDILYHCRKLYNHLLELNNDLYKKTKKGMLGFQMDKYAQDFIKDIDREKQEQRDHRDSLTVEQSQHKEDLGWSH